MVDQNSSDAQSLMVRLAPVFILHFEPKFSNIVVDEDECLRVDISCACASPALFVMDQAVIGEAGGKDLLSNIKTLPINIYCDSCRYISTQDDLADDEYEKGTVFNFRYACPQHHCHNTTFKISILLFPRDELLIANQALTDQQKLLDLLLNINDAFNSIWVESECLSCCSSEYVVDYDLVNRCLI